MESEKIISKIKATAYENVNKKIEEEKKETERKINIELKQVEEILKYIKNRLLFKIVNDYKQEYKLVDENTFFQDYSKEPEHSWQRKGLKINYERTRKWEEFVQVNGESYYDVRYIIRHYEEEFETLKEKLNKLNESFREIEKQEEELLKQEPIIKKFIEEYKELDIEEV